MFTNDLNALLQTFLPQDQEQILGHITVYDDLLAQLPRVDQQPLERSQQNFGILALNGASGAGQSYVMARVQKLLDARSMALPRIYLLATRAPRPGEGHKDPYIFVEEVSEGYRDIYHPNVIYTSEDLYYFYQSRPGAINAILLKDARAALKDVRYLETVIPTLLHIKTTQIGDIPAWGDNLQILYLAAPSGVEWVYRLLNREPAKLEDETFRAKILGRLSSSIDDMRMTAEHNIPCVLNRHGEAERAAQDILTGWGL